MKIVSWNVNGIRAIAKKGFSEWLAGADPDVLCLQETKAQPDQLTEELTEPSGYRTFWASAEKKGYSGVAVYSRFEPESVRTMGIAQFDSEGRVLVVEYPTFTLITAYFPNSQDGGKRLGYKIEFCDAMHQLCDELTAKGRKLVLCGDYNVSHKPIDLARPKENESSAGYLPEERAWMDRFTGGGYVDTFRKFVSDGGHYTWWSYITRGRERNVGWRLDYHCVNGPMDPHVADSTIQDEVMGSDHCPVTLQLQGLTWESGTT